MYDPLFFSILFTYTYVKIQNDQDVHLLGKCFYKIERISFGKDKSGDHHFFFVRTFTKIF